MAEQGPWSLPALQRQFAYDRLLARLYFVDDGWVVKGAAALLAREIGVRGTKDIDIFRMEALAIAEVDLRRAAELHLGDRCRFQVGASQQATQAATALRIPITLSIGTAQWAAFSVDLVGDQLTMTGEPEEVPPLARVAIPDVEQRGYKAYPLVDHVADKVVATFDRYGSGGFPSTRYKDLLDLVAIASTSEIDAAAQAAALTSEAARRGVHLPDGFVVPDRGLWEPGYAREARASVAPVPATPDAGVTVTTSHGAATCSPTLDESPTSPATVHHLTRGLLPRR